MGGSGGKGGFPQEIHRIPTAFPLIFHNWAAVSLDSLRFHRLSFVRSGTEVLFCEVDLCRGSVVERLVQPLVVVEGEVGGQTGLELGDRLVVA